MTTFKQLRQLPRVTSVPGESVIAAQRPDGVTVGVDANFFSGGASTLATENIVTANYTLALSDLGRVVAVNSSSSRTITVPANASVSFPIGSIVNVYRAGSGAVSVTAASGVTVRNAGNIENQFGEVSLRKRGANEWVLSGAVT